MKRALLVGIDEYDQFSPLGGCVNDVRALMPLLARNEDGSPNFNCQTLTSGADRVTRRALNQAVDRLFRPGADVALLFFAGHGSASPGDVVLALQDSAHDDPGLRLSEVLAKVQQSPVREVILMLDCCFSGGAGGVAQIGTDVAALREGVTLLTASRADQPAAETPRGRGAFSVHLCGALDGGAADVVGKVNVAGIYAYLTEAFGPWEQRPMFKAHLDRLNVIRVCAPAVPLVELRRLPEFFPTPDYELPLDPSYEPDAEPEDVEHQAIFGILQRCRAAKLVEPVGEEHMYYAAVNSTACRLTPLGKHYRALANANRL